MGEEQAIRHKSQKEYKQLDDEMQSREKQLVSMNKMYQQKGEALAQNERILKALGQKMQQFRQPKEQIPVRAQFERISREIQVLHGDISRYDKMCKISRRAVKVHNRALESFQRKMDSLDQMYKFDLSLVEHANYQSDLNVVEPELAR